MTKAVQFLLHHHAETVRGYDPNSADEALKHAARLKKADPKKKAAEEDPDADPDADPEGKDK